MGKTFINEKNVFLVYSKIYENSVKTSTEENNVNTYFPFNLKYPIIHQEAVYTYTGWFS